MDNSVFVIRDISGTKLVTHWKQSFSHLNEYTLQLNFIDMIDAMCL